MDHIFSIGQVGRRLGVKAYKISYAIEVGQLPEAAGLTVEHYPMPVKCGLGRRHRRPCGMDSANRSSFAKV